jgi:alkylated DNA repair dioxygenase AlkB
VLKLLGIQIHHKPKMASLTATWISSSGKQCEQQADWTYKSDRCTGIYRNLLKHVVDDDEKMEKLCEAVKSEQTLARSMAAMKYRGNELNRAKQFYVKDTDAVRLYRYPGMTFASAGLYKKIGETPFINALVDIVAGITFGEKTLDANHVILTRYEKKTDDIGRHMDKAKDIAKDSIIVMLSFGDKRQFVFDRPSYATVTGKKQPQDVSHVDIVKAVLRECDVVVMDTVTNGELKHSVHSAVNETIKRSKPASLRVSLVLRDISTVMDDATLAKKIAVSRKAKLVRDRKKTERKAAREAAARAALIGIDRKRSVETVEVVASAKRQK